MTPASVQIADDQPITMTSPTARVELAELYERHYEAVFRAALRVTGNPADAEDVLQTVFLRLLARGRGLARDRGLVRGDGAEPDPLPPAYFRRAAVNAAVDLLRRRAVHAQSAYDDEALHAAVPPPSLLKEQLRRAILTLDGDDAALFLLRHVEGLSLEELAQMFDLEKNNVSVRLHRIRHRLQAEMDR